MLGYSGFGSGFQVIDWQCPSFSRFRLNSSTSSKLYEKRWLFIAPGVKQLRLSVAVLFMAEKFRSPSADVAG